VWPHTGIVAAPRYRVSNAGVFVGVVIAHLVAMAACYHPEVKDCTVQCSAPTDCTGGQICRSDGWCAMPDITSCPKGGGDTGGTLDAATTTGDAPDPATMLCQQGCTNGSCVAGVCVIDCSATMSCQNDVVCPANLPCRVICGERACAHKVNCTQATSCQVQCNGDSSCQDEIQCGSNRCDVDCIGASSCKRRTKCANACACDVTCLGAGSCAEASECPESSCKLGNGCSSLLAGCNDC
jgi:hypothetical protein